jgi:hypothetical protein
MHNDHGEHAPQEFGLVPADANLREDTRIARAHLEGKREWELIGMTPKGAVYRAPMELGRRLMVLIKDLREELHGFKTPSEAWAKRLAWLTVILIVLSVALIIATCLLLANS